MYMLEIGYKQDFDTLITHAFFYDSLPAAKAAVGELLPGVVWEEHGEYEIVDLHQFSHGRVVFVDTTRQYLEVFKIAVCPLVLNEPLPYNRLFPVVN